jgi:uncharacterized protein YjbJ (UPF0337 family)
MLRVSQIDATGALDAALEARVIVLGFDPKPDGADRHVDAIASKAADRIETRIIPETSPWNLAYDPALKRRQRRRPMDKEDVKGAAHRAKNELMKAAGKLMDDKNLRAEGKIDKAKGVAREALGDAKDAAKRIHNP